MNKPLLVIGGGGHAKVLVELLLKGNEKIIGIVAPQRADSLVFKEITSYESDERILDFDPTQILLVNGIGAMPGNNYREMLFNSYKRKGYSFFTIVSPDAVVSEYAVLAEGVQILNGVMVNADAKIGENTILNTGSIIEHDCIIGANNHIAPGATLSGSVTTGNRVHIGTGASIIQNVNIASDSLIAAGAIVNKSIDIPDQVLYPAIGLLTEKRTRL